MRFLEKGRVGGSSGLAFVYVVLQRLLLLSVTYVTITHADSGFAGPASEQILAGQLLRQLSGTTSGNVLVSPVGAQDVLRVLAEGARGKTQEQILRLTSSAESKDECAGEVSADGRVQWSCAMALFHRKDLGLNPDFVRYIHRRHDVVLGRLDEPGSLHEVNAWVARKTRGLIPSVLERVDVNLRLVLVGANYFHGRWATPFALSATKPAEFHTGSDHFEVQMMSQNITTQYLSSKQYDAVELPYDADHVAVVILPKTDLAGLLTRLSVVLHEIQAQSAPQSGEVRLPKFSVRKDFSLKPVLERLGIRAAFSPLEADFTALSPLGKGLFVGDIRHQAVLRIDESGTEAASATTAQMFGSLPAPAKQFSFIVDRPFVFLVIRRSQMRVMFAALIRDPRSAN